MWISWLFLSPVVGGLALQWYAFLTVRPISFCPLRFNKTFHNQTGTVVRMEGIITELIFEHALRIRMKAEIPLSEKPSSGESTLVPTPDTVPVVESECQVEGATRHGDSARPSGNSNETILTRNQTITLTDKSKACKGKRKDVDLSKTKDIQVTKSEQQLTSRNLLGKLNNLVSTDLSNITHGRDFMMLCKRIIMSHRGVNA